MDVWLVHRVRVTCQSAGASVCSGVYTSKSKQPAEMSVMHAKSGNANIQGTSKSGKNDTEDVI